jgi:hypothetical protein
MSFSIWAQSKTKPGLALRRGMAMVNKSIRIIQSKNSAPFDHGTQYFTITHDNWSKMNMIEICPKCGGTAVLLQMKEEIQEMPDLSSPTGTVRSRVKVEEFKCQEQSCEHEFEKVIREPNT